MLSYGSRACYKDSLTVYLLKLPVAVPVMGALLALKLVKFFVDLKDGAYYKFRYGYAVYSRAVFESYAAVFKILKIKLVIARRGSMNIIKLWKSVYIVMLEKVKAYNSIDIAEIQTVI